MVGVVALGTYNGFAAPHPHPLLKLLRAEVHIIPFDRKNTCHVKIDQPGQPTYMSPFLRCPELYSHLSQKLAQLPKNTKPIITIQAPEGFPLRMVVQEGKIYSLRKSSMADSFKVVKGSIDFQDHPDAFEPTQDRLATSFDLKTSLKEIERTLPSRP